MITIHPCGFGRMLAGFSVRSACVKNPMGRALTLTPPRLGEVTLPATFFLSKKKNQYHPKFFQFSLLTHPQSNTMDLSKPQFGASSSSSSSSTHSFTNDVFLSFRGPDTRNNFIGHLYSKLVDKGIKTFIDNDLTRGEDITEELLKVIEGSRISIVVFSAGYASSKCCLDELVKIIQCKESNGQIVYPIFYKVDPADIRYQKGQIGKGIAHLSKRKDNLEKVGSWEAALTEVSTLFGWHISEGGHEANIIDEIVEKISTEIMKCTALNVATHPVGIKSRVEDILKLLSVGQDNPHMVGIWGIGGIGKSTLAKAVYNSISHEFEHSCFLSIVRGASFSDGSLVQLQNDFLSKIIERNPPKVTNVDAGITVLKQKLSQKRVLLVLDNVNHLDQLRALAGGCDWFGPSSRIIITTRDTNLLNAHRVDFDSIYEVKELNHQDASKLFNLNAFKRDICPDDFFEVATEVIHYAKGIPLVLEVLGSDLCSKKNKDEWKAAVEYYNKYPNQEIQQALKRSYEALEDQMKEVFLHIACFFKGHKQGYVINVLQSCDINPMYSLKVLVEKALIKIEKDNKIWMHDLLEVMGKEIVRQESPDDKGQCSRLWLNEDVRYVLEENTGTEKIKGIMVRCDYSQPIMLNAESFKNLKNLQIFIVDDDGDGDDDVGSKIYTTLPELLKSTVEILCGDSVDYLPNQLRVLGWMRCSLRSLPTNFNPTKLGILHMGGPCTTPLVNEGLKNLRYLKSIKLRGCDGLTRIPDLSGLTSLKYLKLSECKDLVEVHPSVGRLDKLVYLGIRYCKKLQMFQERINLKSLETLDLSDCPLEFFPEIEGDMKSLNRMDLSFTDIKELPCLVGNLTGLKSLSLSWCKNLTNVPSSIFYELQRLERLDLGYCSKLVTFPTKSESLPPPVFSTDLTRLQVKLYKCYRLEEISEFPREIDSLDVWGSGSLERISKLSKILEGKDSKMFRQLDLADCQRLCDNLARRVVTKELMGEADKLAALLTLFFSCPKSEEFKVRFPARAPLPNWLTCRRDVNSEEHEFCIELPQNSNWDKKGLALCIQSNSDDLTRCVYINGIEFDEKRMFGPEVWVHYIPLVTVIRRLSECGMPPPDRFRVMFRLKMNYFKRQMIPREMPSGESWGVHLIEDLEAEGR
ncbi:disease resistance protein RUN1-like [Rosa rugosa]|uniref:disease resistance protein RUN1-like n=1 Tax=Rosa rugosa TaxID=74645 RepID=UPI002B41537D|nr:disease resistance protein RUN1-like [Rosa rugosa]XP_062023981.1 disease resistance protein RUN1-like [Rosa rugosa]XP_062023982.1 disease resistance protein RUN1-like [Rosa rugosa]XP_062023983.1 disease resistance protein RUN1-like [Rosa rugosa]XP_062023984.1 disease resistance protein RUN1-like [Rosa rugosa]XP_062023985.1 disease resistance protein RUN1-like [Rosa rugosa]XP_062023986.1 disease resistance protein RUN1-like [Rosa rugosa]XP_062023988.1 disease resistance protein RUN1-like [